MITFLGALTANRSGASAAEYALILGLVSVAIIAGASALGTAIAAPFADAATEIAN
jgi:pilus assembly protein Flp/PilA